jgi:uncharacterized membrane protein YphA (DoxX/SURF4 family)
VQDDTALRRVLLVVGWTFVVASLPKFLAYGWERDNFVRFGLPYAGAWVIAAGVLELVGGVLLLRRRLVVPVSVVLIVVMAVAIAVSGVKEGDVVPSLTVAPALLVALVFLVVRQTRSTASQDRSGADDDSGKLHALSRP